MRFSTLAMPIKAINNARDTLNKVNDEVLKLHQEKETLEKFAPGLRATLIARPNGTTATVAKRLEEIDTTLETYIGIGKQEIRQYKEEFAREVIKQTMPSGKNLRDNDDFLLLQAGLIDNEQSLFALSQKYSSDTAMRNAINVYARKNNMPSAIIEYNTSALENFMNDYFDKCIQSVGRYHGNVDTIDEHGFVRERDKATSESYWQMFINNEKAIHDYISSYQLLNEYNRGNGLDYMDEYSAFTDGAAAGNMTKGTGEKAGTDAAEGSIINPSKQ